MGEDVAEEPWLPRACFTRTAMTKCTLRLSVLVTKDPAEPFGGAKGEKTSELDAHNFLSRRNLRTVDRAAECSGLVATRESKRCIRGRRRRDTTKKNSGPRQFRRVRAIGSHSAGLGRVSWWPTWLVWSLAVGFGFSRLVHVIGMLFTATPRVRATAMLVNHLSFLAAGIWLVSSV